MVQFNNFPIYGVGVNLEASLEASTLRFADISAMSLSDAATDGALATVISAFNGEPEGFIYDGTSEAAANGATIVDAVGMGSGRWISVRTSYKDFSDMASNIISHGDGTVFRTLTEGFSYVEDSGSSFSEGGVGLRPLAGGDGLITASQVGCGTPDDSSRFTYLVSTLAAGLTDKIAVDVDVNLTGDDNASGVFEAADIPSGSVIQFENDAALVYNSDGSVGDGHPYFQITGATGFVLRNPYVRSSTAPTTRTSNPAINLIGCSNSRVYDYKVKDTSGGGLMIRGCNDVVGYNGYAEGTMADGHMIYNDATYGPSIDCYTYNSHSLETGDDGVSIVGYTARGAANLRCGHINYTTTNGSERGGVLVGAIDSVLIGSSSNCHSSGLKVVADLGALETHGNTNCHVGVTSVDDGENGQASVDIGNYTDGLTGWAKVIGGAGRGIQIAGDTSGPKDIHMDLYSDGATLAGVYFGNVSGLTVGKLTSLNAGETGCNGVDSTDVAIGVVNIRDYNTEDDSGNTGIRLNNVSGVVSSGVVSDSNATTIRPVDLLNCVGLKIGDDTILSGGTASKKVNVQASCSDVTVPSVLGSTTWNPSSIPAGGYVSTTLTVAGASIGDVVTASFTEMQAGLVLSGFVFGANSVRITLENKTASAIDPAEGTVVVKLDKYTA